MSGDPFNTPEWREYAKRARKELLPKIRGSAIGMSLYTGKADPKIAIETGYLILLDKPIILVVTPGVKVPSKLARVADEIIELAPDDPSFPERLSAAVLRVTESGGVKG